MIIIATTSLTIKFLFSTNVISTLSLFSLHLKDAVEYAECEAVVKEFPPFREAMKKRGIEDMDLVMVDPWLVTGSR